MTAPTNEAIATLAKGFADRGLIIEAGWRVMLVHVLPEGAPEVQVVEMRKAFFAGAHHLFGSMLSLLDGNDGQPTEDDLRRMDQIHKELERFGEELAAEAAREERA